MGSVSAVTDNNGSIVETYEYDVFGLATIKDASGNTLLSSAIGNTILYTGRRWDSESELYYYRARYYDPAIGKFLQRDPIGFMAGPNLYAYVSNNSVNYIDPLGLCDNKECEKIRKKLNF